jgi:hypothetical protein
LIMSALPTTAAEEQSSPNCRLGSRTGSEPSFDCFVGLGELRRLESATESLGSLKVDCKLELGLWLVKSLEIGTTNGASDSLGYLVRRSAVLVGSDSSLGASRGRVTQKIVPFPGVETSVIRPPSLCVTILYTI